MFRMVLKRVKLH